MMKNENLEMLRVHCIIHRENIESKIFLLFLMRYYAQLQNVSMLTKRMQNVSVSSSNFVEMKMQTMCDFCLTQR